MVTLLDGGQSHQRVYSVGGEWVPNATVPCSTPFTLRTLDASGNQIREGMTDASALIRDDLFPATGHVYVDGIKAGDGIAIEILQVSPVESGHIWTRPGLGFGPTPGFHVRKVHTNDLKLDLGHVIVPLESRLHVGTIGVAPIEKTQARDVGVHGGNIDSHFLRPGATLLLGAQLDGAGIFAADVHVAIGDAEICGTGVETEAVVELRASRLPWAPPLPIILDSGRAWVIGTADSIEEALDGVLRFLHVRMTEELQIDEADAYLMIASCLEMRVCQVVNPHPSIAVSLGSGLDRLIVPREARDIVVHGPALRQK